MKSGQMVPGPRNTRIGNRYVQPRAQKSIFEKSFMYIASRVANLFCANVDVGNLRSKGTKKLLKIGYLIKLLRSWKY
jgi:hypothetical protein